MRLPSQPLVTRSLLLIALTALTGGIAPAQVQGANISVCHGVGGMFGASGTIIMTNET